MPRHAKADAPFFAAWQSLRANPMLAPLAKACDLGAEDSEGTLVGARGWASIGELGTVRVRRGADKFGTAAEWSWVFSCLLLQAALLEWREGARLSPSESAALGVEARRLARLAKAGTPPDELAFELSAFPSRGYRELAAWIDRSGSSAPSWPPSLAGDGLPELRLSGEKLPSWRSRPNFAHALAEGISAAAESAVNRAGGREGGSETLAAKARRWIMDCYPLLGASACLFEIIEDPAVCDRERVSIAAVAPASREILLHPRARLDFEETKFVLAHEILHAALDHLGRRRGRDPMLWNCACDFVVNSWLIEMRLGKPPALGLLIDPAYDGLSAEDVYDRLAQELRRSGRLVCLSGECGSPDLLERPGSASASGEALRRSLLSGLDLHRSLGRGTLPGGLEEEIRAIASPPAPWDVRLAEWMSARFQPEERERSYARLSRRQSACPDIPLAGRRPRDAERKARVMAAIVDTSASMDRHLLGKALGALASTCESLEVDYVRLIWCDAGAADAGWREPRDLWGKLRAKGRGGTALQEGIDLLRDLASREDLPKNAPVLLITDGWCEAALDPRGFDTAALLPEGAPKPRGVGEFFRLE